MLRRTAKSEGESVISIHETEIINESWAQLEKGKRANNYKIIPVSSSLFVWESVNPELGKQTGTFNLDRNTLFSKFKIEGSTLNGYEIICREEDMCYAYGALYEADSLINSWTAIMKKEKTVE